MFSQTLRSRTCNQPTSCRAGTPRALTRIGVRIGVRSRAHAKRLLRPSSASGSQSSPPTWDELTSKLPSEPGPMKVWDPVRDISQCRRPDGHPPTRSGLAVLYRDKNGWCPYSERVWLGLEFKGVEFDEVLINNQGSKPQFWYSMAGGTTPVIRWPSGKTQGESMDILMELDEMFPDCNGGGAGGGGGGRLLLPSDPQSRAKACQIANSLKATLPRMCRPSSRAAFLYRGSGPVPRKEFEASLDTLEEVLGASGGPFFMGETFTIADCAWVPFLERYAVQLPLLYEGLEPRDPERWPCLARWYGALEEEIPAYSARVQGDALSWAAVLAVAGYGNAGSAAEYKAPQKLSFQLGTSSAGQKIWEAYASGASWLGATPAEEAARILVSNRTAILSDCLKHSAEAIGDESQADTALRFCSQLIMAQGNATRRADAAEDLPFISELNDLPPSSLATVQAVAEYLHTRICVPRDMGRLAADCYHAALSPLLQPPDDAGRY